MNHPVAQQLGHLTGLSEAGSDQRFELQVSIHIISTDSTGLGKYVSLPALMHFKKKINLNAFLKAFC